METRDFSPLRDIVMYVAMASNLLWFINTNCHGKKHIYRTL